MKRFIIPMISTAVLSVVLCVGCKNTTPQEEPEVSPLQQKVDEYALVKLTTDLSVLSEKEQQLIPIFIEIADIKHSTTFVNLAYSNKWFSTLKMLLKIQKQISQ